MAKQYVKWDAYENGVDGNITGEKANQIIEEIIGIMKENKITVETAELILTDTISSIKKDTLVT